MQRFVLARVKGNLSAPPKALAYHVREVHRGSIVTMAIIWDGVVEQEADDLLHEEQRGAKPTRLEEAKGWLRAMLADGPLRARQMMAEAKKAGLKPRTVERAKQELSVDDYQRVCVRKDGTKTKRWWWALPKRSDR